MADERIVQDLIQRVHSQRDTDQQDYDIKVGLQSFRRKSMFAEMPPLLFDEESVGWENISTKILSRFNAEFKDGEKDRISEVASSDYSSSSDSSSSASDVDSNSPEGSDDESEGDANEHSHDKGKKAKRGIYEETSSNESSPELRKIRDRKKRPTLPTRDPHEFLFGASERYELVSAKDAHQSHLNMIKSDFDNLEDDEGSLLGAEKAEIPLIHAKTGAPKELQLDLIPTSKSVGSRKNTKRRGSQMSTGTNGSTKARSRSSREGSLNHSPAIGQSRRSSTQVQRESSDLPKISETKVVSRQATGNSNGRLSTSLRPSESQLSIPDSTDFSKRRSRSQTIKQNKSASIISQSGDADDPGSSNKNIRRRRKVSHTVLDPSTRGTLKPLEPLKGVGRSPNRRRTKKSAASKSKTADTERIPTEKMIKQILFGKDLLEDEMGKFKFLNYEPIQNYDPFHPMSPQELPEYKLTHQVHRRTKSEDCSVNHLESMLYELPSQGMRKTGQLKRYVRRKSCLCKACSGGNAYKYAHKMQTIFMSEEKSVGSSRDFSSFFAKMIIRRLQRGRTVGGPNSHKRYSLSAKVPKRFSYMSPGFGYRELSRHPSGETIPEESSRLTPGKATNGTKNPTSSQEKSSAPSILETKGLFNMHNPQRTGSTSSPGSSTVASVNTHEEEGKNQELGSSLIATLKTIIKGKEASPSPSRSPSRSHKTRHHHFTFSHKRTVTGIKSAKKKDAYRRASAMTSIGGDFARIRGTSRHNTPQATSGTKTKRVSYSKLGSGTKDLAALNSTSEKTKIKKSQTCNNELPTIRMLGDHPIETAADLEPVLQHMCESDLERLMASSALDENEMIPQDEQEESAVESAYLRKKYKPSLANNFSDFRRREIRSFMPVKLNTTMNRSTQELSHGSAGTTISVDINIRSPNRLRLQQNDSPPSLEVTEHKLIQRLAPKGFQIPKKSMNSRSSQRSNHSSKRALRSIGQTLQSEGSFLGTSTSALNSARKSFTLQHSEHTHSHGHLAPINKSVHSVYAPRDMQSSIPFLSSRVQTARSGTSAASKRSLTKTGSESQPILPRVHIKQSQKEGERFSATHSSGKTSSSSGFLKKKTKQHALKKTATRLEIAPLNLGSRSTKNLNRGSADLTVDFGFRRMASPASTSSSTSVLHRSVYSIGGGSSSSRRR